MPKKWVIKGGRISQSSENEGGIWNIAEKYHLNYQTGGGGGSISILTPGAVSGMNLYAGQNYNVTWETNTDPELIPVNTVRIEFSQFGGPQMSIVATGIVNSGIYTWEVPAYYTTLGQIRVANDDDASQNPAAIADFHFGITAASGLTPLTTLVVVPQDPIPSEIYEGAIFGTHEANFAASGMMITYSGVATSGIEIIHSGIELSYSVT